MKQAFFLPKFITTHYSSFISTLKIKVRAQQDKINLTLEKKLTIGQTFQLSKLLSHPYHCSKSRHRTIQRNVPSNTHCTVEWNLSTERLSETSSRGNVHSSTKTADLEHKNTPLWSLLLHAQSHDTIQSF